MPLKNKINYLNIVSISVVIIFCIFITILWKTGLLTFSDNDNSTKVLAALIVLIGGVFTSLITLIGLIFKHSIDLRNIAIQERNESLAQQAENRLKIEAAIQSVGLLSTSSGNETSDLQKSGVILTLANLEIFDLAIALSNEMIYRSAINPGSYCWLIDKAIISGNDIIKEQATLSLSNNIDKLIQQNGKMCFPETLVNIQVYPTLPQYVRAVSIDILTDLIILRPFKECNKAELGSLIIYLYNVWEFENDFFKDNAGIAVYHFLKMFDEEKLWNLNNQSYVNKEMAKQLSNCKDFTLDGVSFVNGKDRFSNLLEWCKEKE